MPSSMVPKGIVTGLALTILVAVLTDAAPFPPFPLEDVVAQAKEYAYSSPAPTPTGFTRDTYLDVIAGTVLHMRQFQNKDSKSPDYGKIIDPYAKEEIQYSTPTFAFASATLIKEKHLNQSLQDEVLSDCKLAMTAALTALKFGQPSGDQGCAQGHCNFYTMPLMLALKTLDGVVSDSQMSEWRALAAAIEPTRAYRGWPHAGGNWAIVALTGEYIRYTLGLRNSTEDIEEQLAYQMSAQEWTANGQYQDHSGCSGKCNPMPYDHFPRKYMTVMLDAGYSGPNTSLYWELNERAAWVSLLMQSPWGELPTGGRSSQHQWNEAVSCVTYEYWASKMKLQGDLQAAGLFKRAASLSLKSLKRWKRPTGEWWVVKNRFDPSMRFGYEGYTYYSQYNLLPASMLSTALLFADDTIKEGASFAEVGGFVFSPEMFHKVIANAGGMYAEIELFPDAPPHDVLGLTRIHHASTEPLITTTAGAPSSPEGAPANPTTLAAIGTLWNDTSQQNVYADVTFEGPSYDPSRFKVSNILWSDNPTDSQAGLWLLPYQVTGEAFVLDLLEQQNVYGLRLRNTHNSDYNDFGTKDFQLLVSNDSVSWHSAVKGQLEDVRDQSELPWQTFSLTDTPTPCRYVKFLVDSYYAKGAGLNSFELLGVTRHTVNVTSSQDLASFSFTEVANSSLAIHSTSPQKVSFDVTYVLNTSRTTVKALTERYTVTPNNVSVSSSVADGRPTNYRFPIFFFDGDRTGSYTVHGNGVTVKMLGDATSQLNTTCAKFAVQSSSSVTSALLGKTVNSRNGYMSAIEVSISDAGSATAVITPLGAC